MKKQLLIGLILFVGVFFVAIPIQAQGQWTPAGALNEARTGHTATMLPDGSALIVGGHDEVGVIGTAELFDPASVEVFLLDAQLETARTLHEAVLLNEGFVLFLGGQTADEVINSVELYDPSSEIFVTLAPMNAPRVEHTATLLADGRVLIVGGNDGLNALPWIEIFDPSTGVFSLLDPDVMILTEGRQSHTASLLHDGRVLIVGGYNETGALASTEIIDIKNSVVEAGPVLGEARYGHTATVLASGDVAVAFGTDGTVVHETLDLIDGDSGAIILSLSKEVDPDDTGSSGRFGHFAVLLPNNRNVLFVGGYAPDGNVTNSVEIFDSYAFDFPEFANLQNGRSGSAVVAGDGKVMVIGGVGSDGLSIASVEIKDYPTLATDKSDYPPNSTVTFTGTGWLPDESIDIVIEAVEPNDVVIVSTVADSNGSFVHDQFNVGKEYIDVGLTATAIGTSSGNTASVFFTDSVPPVISAISPATFTSDNSNITVVITGTDLANGTERVYLSGPGINQILSISYATNTELRATIPAWIASRVGTYTIYITQSVRTCYTNCHYSYCHFHSWGYHCHNWHCHTTCSTHHHTSNSVSLTVESGNQPPVAVCQAITVSADDHCQAYVLPEQVDGGSSDPDGDTLTFSLSPAGPYSVGTHTVTLTVSDGQVSDSCQTTITVVDDLEPAIVLNGASLINLECGVDAYVEQGATASDFCDGSIPVTIAGVVDIDAIGLYSVSYSAIDLSGNLAEISRSVIVQDTIAPVITLNGAVEITLECGVDTYSDPGTTVVDAGDPSVTVVVGGDTVDVTTVGTYVVTYDATDASSNAAIQVTRTVTVADTIAPVITLTGPASLTLECGVDTYSDPGTTVVDAGDPSVTVVVGGDTVDVTTVGTYVVTYDATDASSNAAIQVTRTVTVADTIAPVITLTGPASLTLECGVDTYTEQGATVVDAGDPSVTVVVGGDTVDTSTVGAYVVTYDATDASGNVAAQVTQTVTVADTIAPVITLNGAASITLECGIGSYTELSATAADAGDPSVTVSVSGSVNVTTVGTYVVTYNATDASGNVATPVTRTIVVKDTIAPVLTLNGAASLTLECGVDTYTELDATAYDAGNPSVTVVVGGDTVDVATVGTYVVTYDATDASGNVAAQVTRTVTVADTIAPVITLTGPGTIILECAIDEYLEQGATVFDAGDPTVQIVVNNSSVNTLVPGTYTVTYNATDASGNVASQATRSIVVQDTIAPEIWIDSPVAYELYALGDIALSFGATDDPGSGLNSVSGKLVNTFGTTLTVESGYVPAPGVYTLTVTAVDNGGNATTSLPIFFVVYDPTGGFATGGGWLIADNESTLIGGRANFGFVAKYKKGASTGNLEFQYKDAGIDLKSLSIDWLVISATSAQFEGTATIKGFEGLFTFRVRATDTGEPGAGQDHFDIRIWEGTEILEDQDPIHKAKNIISGGNIVIHKK